MILLLKAMWGLAVCFSKANKKPSQWGEKFALDFPGGSDGKESAYNTGDTGLVAGSGRSPGEGMATHYSTLAWRILWMEEFGGLQSMGSQRVGHD